MPNWFRDSLIEFCNLFQTHYQPSIVAIIEKILISLYITTLCVNTRKIHHLYQRGLICRGISKHFITGLNIHFLGKRDILWYSLPVFSQTYHTHQRVFIYREITARSLWESFSQSISTYKPTLCIHSKKKRIAKLKLYQLKWRLVTIFDIPFKRKFGQ